MTQKTKGFPIVLLAAILLTGCPKTVIVIGTPSDAAAVEAMPLSDTEKVKRALYAHFAEWRSVRYRSGGLSKRGIDCSGFVYITYQKLFDIKLPRDTKSQSTSGRRIFQKNLKPGDLVFFKTGWFDRHVGIYLENRKFIQVSTRRGVQITSLDDPYWAAKYWQSIRIKK